MQLNSLRVPFVTSLSIGTMLTAVAAAQQGTLAKPDGNAGTNGPDAAKAARAAELEGLPPFLQLVPSGTVEVGLDAEQFVNAACQVVSPAKPAMAAKLSPAKLTDAMRKSVSMLGRRKVDVHTFLLAKWSVKCSEYDVYVRHRRQANAKFRAPFGQWRYGCKDDYEKHLPEINREFPKMENAPVLYWERHGAELPYALQDDKGRSIADQPVTYVSWRDANEFAGWLGMRLPTEVEWTRAARGDGTHVWPHATPQDPASDAFSEELLKQLRIYNRLDQVPKTCGAVPAAAGPFGHLDMFGQVWQLIGDLGFRPIQGPDAFATEWKKLQKDKVGQLLPAPPQWRDEKVIAKGGSYLSTNDPIQLTIDARAPMQTVDVLESVGFRLAKSLRPGYDMMFSLLRGIYPRSQFAIDQDVALESQVGAERYELGADGFPTAYHAVSFAPVNWLAKDKAELQKLVERSQTVPMLIGTLATTEAMAEPAVPAGIWSVLYRRDGTPRELVEAIKAGHRELTNVVKSKTKEGDAKEGEPKPEPSEGDQEKKEKPKDWRTVIARFGLTEQDIAGKEAADGNVKFIRIDGLDVPTDRDVFLVHGNKEDKDGKLKEQAVAWLPATNAKPGIVAAFASKLLIEGSDKGKAVVKLHFGVPLSLTNPKRVVEFHLPVTLDMALPTADKPWRLPQ